MSEQAIVSSDLSGLGVTHPDSPKIGDILENEEDMSDFLLVVPLTMGSVPLHKAPTGLFDFDGTLCVKTEYSTNGRPDAYIVDTGEYFWGGTSSPKEAANHMVTPMTVRFNEEIACETKSGESSG